MEDFSPRRVQKGPIKRASSNKYTFVRLVKQCRYHEEQKLQPHEDLAAIWPGLVWQRIFV